MTSKNAACPCGSGLKFKRCCFSKTPSKETFDPNESWVDQQLRRGMLSLNQGDMAKAEKYYSDILLVEPHNAVGNHNLGVVYGRQELQTRALPFFQKALAMDPNNLIHRQSLARCYLEQKLYLSALERLRPILSTTSENTDTKTILYSACLNASTQEFSQHNYSGCVEWCSIALNWMPEHVEFWSILIKGLIQQNLWKDAITACEIARARFPSHEEILELSGVTLFHVHQYTDANIFFEKRYQLDHKKQLIHDNYAANCRELGQGNLALSILSQNSNGISSSHAHYIFASIYSDYGNKPKAIHHIEQAITLDLGSQSTNRPIRSPISAYDPAQAITTLLKVKELLNYASIPFFLIAGTLLGIVRDSELLPHDKDLDIGVFEDVEPQTLISLLTTNGNFHYIQRHPKAPEGKEHLLTFLDSTTQITLDIFIYYKLADHYESGVYKLPHPITNRFPIFSLELIKWQGTTWLAPSPPNLYLKLLYGDQWQEPDLLFDTVLSSNSRTAESIPARVIYGYLRLYKLILNKQTDKACATIDQIQALEKNNLLEKFKLQLLQMMKP